MPMDELTKIRKILRAVEQARDLSDEGFQYVMGRLREMAEARERGESLEEPSPATIADPAVEEF